MEFRKDYILDRYVIVSTVRAKRPHEFKQEIKIEKEKGPCYFCPGNEKLTPPEIGRIGTKNKWRMRWFANKFSAVEEKGNPEFQTDNSFFTYAQPYGRHEIIVETPNHKKQLWDLNEKQLKQLLEVYSSRITELSSVPNIKYVCLFKNHGKEGGTSLLHSHSQIIAYNKIPKLIQDEVDISNLYQGCPYCQILNIEKTSDRRCFENENFVAFTPYASRFHFEIWIFPKEHINNITEMDDIKLEDLASILKQILKKLKGLNAPYNIQFHYSPEGEDLHFHIEVCPRLAVWAGFELLTNDTINSLPPEDAAKYYRGNKS
jgi:UDPglucose--hexose-1-phosphate uridylyltransferase